MAYSASAARGLLPATHPSFYFFGRQLVWVGIGVGAMWFLSRVDYAWFRKAAVPIAGLALAGLLLVLVPGVGTVVNGARRWIYLGGQGVQPSEFAKIAAVILIAALIVRRPVGGHHAQGVRAAHAHRHRPGRGPHHARAGPRHHTRAGDRRRGRAHRRRRAPALPVRPLLHRRVRGARAHRRRAVPAGAPDHVLRSRGRTSRAAATRPRSRSSPSPRGACSGSGSATRCRSSGSCPSRPPT